MKPVFFLCVMLLLNACSSLKPLQLNPDDGLDRLPEQWRHQADTSDDILEREWWQGFGSSELDALVQRAQAVNYDLAAAVARVEQAQKLAVVAGAPLLPEVSALVNAGRQRRLGASSDAQALSTYSAGLAASYEIDFWGKNRSAYQGALARIQASEFDRDSLRLTISASVANTWMEVTGLRARAEIARRNLENAEKVLALVESRYRSGAANPIELAQQQGLVATQRRILALLQQQQGNAEAILATLLSQPLADLQLGNNVLVDVQVPETSAGLPAALLTRRPDIARAEATLLAFQADIQVARAVMLPSITLNGGIYSNSEHLRSFLDNPLYSLAAGLAAPIFNAGRLAAQRDYAIARRQELLANYRQAIVAAFGDVEAALNRIAGLEQQAAAQTVAQENAERAFAFAQSRYQAGAETLLTLLDTQRTLFAAQDLSLQVRQQRLQASVDLYRALGGGWQRIP
ncbi:efflux transporter outer membrane subunit [Methylobacillus arboreus]|uniref:efflux transporter outer membrane subunit n=1 Tax=Methylobacillus arboreus TaxID=755170 RepID=UPI001E3E19E0|nr:efflux transporter outer membrane subunit [Methylobacillus arboreus]MCB5190943.1 efflux transporter outer membrane subunit [Methylobacillus arboreus]